MRIHCGCEFVSVVLSWFSHAVLCLLGWRPSVYMLHVNSMLIAKYTHTFDVWLYLLYLYAEGEAHRSVIIVPKVKWWMKLLPFVSLNPICKIQNVYNQFKGKIVLIPFDSFKSCADCCLEVARNHNFRIDCIKLNNDPCHRTIVVGESHSLPNTQIHFINFINDFMSSNNQPHNEGKFNSLTLGSCLLLLPSVWMMVTAVYTWDIFIVSVISWYTAYKYHLYYELDDDSSQTFHSWLDYLCVYYVCRSLIVSSTWFVFWCQLSAVVSLFQLSLAGGARSEYMVRPYLYARCVCVKYMIMAALGCISVN